MQRQKKVLRFINPLSEKRAATNIGVNALHQTAMRLADISNTRRRLKAKDLISLLFCHGARLGRAGSGRACQPAQCAADDADHRDGGL